MESIETFVEMVNEGTITGEGSGISVMIESNEIMRRPGFAVTGGFVCIH